MKSLFLAQIFFGCLAAALIFVSSNGVAQENRPRRISLEGDIVLIGYYGPPGFGEDPNSDKLVKAPALRLPRAITVFVRSISGSSQPRKIDLIQIIDPVPYVFRKSCGKRIKIKGEIIEPDTSDSGTAVMIDVKNYEVLSTFTCKDIGLRGLRGFQ